MTADIAEVATLSGYFRGRVFFFLPNVCDANCAFCYVRPTLARRAHLPAGVMGRTRSLLSGLAEHGFREVRLTGGEPLLVDNLDELVDECVAHGLRYTVLSNGGKLSRWQKLFHRAPPSKLTVSIHSTSRKANVFGVPWDMDEVLSNIESLSADISVAATVVAMPDVLPSFRRTVSDLVAAGVTELKLVQPNVAVGRPTPAQFASLARQAIEIAGPRVRVRMSDLSRRECVLHREGQLSVALPSFRVWSCCVKVGDNEFETIDRFDAVGVRAMLLWAQDQVVRAPARLPCKAHYGACPIALAVPADD